MKSRLSHYKEFQDRDAALNAVRALQAAGIEDVETVELSHHMRTNEDQGLSMTRSKLHFIIKGVGIGLLGGLVWGILVFLIPSYFQDIANPIVISIFGLVLCVGVGAGIGLFHSVEMVDFVKPKDCTTGLDGEVIGVRVFAEDSGTLKQAIQILQPNIVSEFNRAHSKMVEI